MMTASASGLPNDYRYGDTTNIRYLEGLGSRYWTPMLRLNITYTSKTESRHRLLSCRTMWITNSLALIEAIGSTDGRKSRVLSTTTSSGTGVDVTRSKRCAPTRYP